MAAVPVKIPAELFALAESSRFSGEYDLGVLAIGPDDYAFEAPLTWTVDITNTGSALLVAGKVEGRGVCSCSRCLEDVSHDFQGVVEGYFLVNAAGRPDVAGEDDDDEVGEDEFDVLPDDHIIDLAPLLEAAMMVDAPQMPLCKDDCLGLCPQCGANLNEGPCGCGPEGSLAEFEKAANPFSALADFKFE